MEPIVPVLLVFAYAWLLAALWLVLMSMLLNQLISNDPEAYTALGSPIMRWLWWSWPAPGRDRPPFLSVTELTKGRLELTTMYSPREIGSISRVAIWIFFNHPTLEVSRLTKRHQRRIRACGIGFAVCLIVILIMVAIGSA